MKLRRWLSLLSVYVLLCGMLPMSVSAAADKYPLKNGDFEAGNLDQWTAMKSVSASATAAYAGNYGCLITGDGDWDDLLSQTFAVLPGHTYTLSFWYKANPMGVSWYLESLLGTVLDVTTMMGAEYTEASFSGEGVNVFRVAVASVPMLMAVIYGKPLFRDTEPEEDLMFNLAMMNALIMFVGLFGTANYFARLANYFLPAQVIVLPWLLNRTAPVDRTWLKPACVLGYLAYFYYEYGILHPFDGEYSQISIWSYLGDLWGRLM